MASELCESAMIIERLNEEFDEVVKEKDELSKELKLLKEKELEKLWENIMKLLLEKKQLFLYLNHLDVWVTIS